MDKVKKFLPAIIFVVAFAIRLVGINWGLPSAKHHQTYHPDEEVIWNYSQAIEPGKFDFTPGFYNYGTLYLTTLRIATDMVGVYGGHMKQPEGVPPSSPTLTDWEFVGRSHKAGRIISAVFGALFPVFVFLILRRWTNSFGALMGSAIAAFSPALVVHSRFQTVDVMAATLLVISSYFALRFLPSGTDEPPEKPLKIALAAGAFAGLSAGTKYTGVLVIFTLFAALWLAKHPERLKLALVGVAAMLASFFVATPGVLLETGRFIENFKYEILHTNTGHGLIFERRGSGFASHIGNLIQTLTPFALFLGLVGIGLAMFKKPEAGGRIIRSENAWILALSAFALPYFILIGRAEVTFLRYTFPLILILAAGFGWLVGWGHERKGKWTVLPAVGLLTLGLILMVTARFTLWMTGPDPRDLAAERLKEEGAGKTVGLVSDPWYYTPSLFPDSALSRMPVVARGNPTPGFLYQMREMMALADPAVVRYFPGDQASDRYDWDVRLLTEVKPDFVVYSSFEEQDVKRLLGASGLGEIPKLLVERYREFYKELQNSYDPYLAHGDPDALSLAHDLQYIQPVIYIWKRKN
jgi:hypothetical protein